MLMRDHPLAVDLTEANRHAHPDISLLPVCARSTDPVEAVTEGHAIARSYAQVANFVADWTLECG